jgi:quercetin 2,3-dioxygenase
MTTPRLTLGRPLAAGDAVRFTATGGQRVTAAEPAEILVWEMHATLR